MKAHGVKIEGQNYSINKFIMFYLIKFKIIFSTCIFLLFSNTYAQGNNGELSILKQYQKNKEYDEKINNLTEQLVLINNKLDTQKAQYSELKKIISNNTNTKNISKNNDINNIVVVANKSYRNARNLLLAEQYDNAIAALKKYTEEYPQAANIADAKFWLASAYMANKNYAKASHQYLLFQIHYQSHYKVPRALYKLAIAQYELGLPDKAEILFKSIVRRFPNNKIASLAKQSLAELNKNNINTNNSTVTL